MPYDEQEARLENAVRAAMQQQDAALAARNYARHREATAQLRDADQSLQQYRRTHYPLAA